MVQAGSGGNAITIMFKEFGVRLNFTPTVLGGDLIHLKVKPEVSSLDFTNAVDDRGLPHPRARDAPHRDRSRAARRTDVRDRRPDEQHADVARCTKIPGIGDIPILGLLFKSKAHQKNQTELVVMITPQIIKKGQMGVSEGLPSLVEPYLARPNKTYPSPDPYVGSPRYPADQPQPKEGNGTAQPRQGTAQSMPQPLNPSTAPAQKATPAAAPLPARPISQPAPAAPKPAAATPAPKSPAPSAAKSTAPATNQSAVKAEVTEVDRAAERASQKATEQERKASEAAQLKAEEDRRQADRLGKERAKREAEIARKNAENAKKQSDEDAKREKALAEAATRLKQAQSAYQAEVEKAKGGSNEKPGSTNKQ